MADCFAAHPDELLRAAALAEATAEQLRAALSRPGLQAPGALGPAEVTAAFSAFVGVWSPYAVSYVAEAETVGPRLRACADNYRAADDASGSPFDAGRGAAGPR